MEGTTSYGGRLSVFLKKGLRFSFEPGAPPRPAEFSFDLPIESELSPVRNGTDQDVVVRGPPGTSQFRPVQSRPMDSANKFTTRRRAPNKHSARLGAIRWQFQREIYNEMPVRLHPTTAMRRWPARPINAPVSPISCLAQFVSFQQRTW